MSPMKEAVSEKEKEEPIEMSFSLTKLKEEVRRTWGEKDRRNTASMVVIGTFPPRYPGQSTVFVTSDEL